MSVEREDASGVVHFEMRATCSPHAGRLLARLLARVGHEFTIELAPRGRDGDRGRGDGRRLTLQVDLLDPLVARSPAGVPHADDVGVPADEPPIVDRTPLSVSIFGAPARPRDAAPAPALRQVPDEATLRVTDDPGDDPLAQFTAESHGEPDSHAALPPPGATPVIDAGAPGAREPRPAVNPTGGVFFSAIPARPLTEGIPLPSTDALRDPVRRTRPKVLARERFHDAVARARALSRRIGSHERVTAGLHSARVAVERLAARTGAGGHRRSRETLVAILLLGVGAFGWLAATRFAAPSAPLTSSTTVAASAAPGASTPRPVPPRSFAGARSEQADSSPDGERHDSDGAAASAVDTDAANGATGTSGVGPAARSSSSGGDGDTSPAETGAGVPAADQSTARGARETPRPAEPAAAAADDDRAAHSRSFVGTLDVRSTPPGALVTVDGVARGRTPVSLPGLRAGAHTVRVDLPGHERWSTAVSVRSGARVTLSPVMRKARTTRRAAEEVGAEATPAEDDLRP